MGTRLFVGNLSYNVTEQELRDAFTGEGIEVRSVRVALDRETGRPRGFAFVETANDEGAKASIEKLSGRLLQGRSIVIEEAQAKPAGPRPGAPGAAPGGPARFGAPRPPGAPAGASPGGPSAGFGPPRAPGGFGGGPRFASSPPAGGPRPGGGLDPRFTRPAEAPRRERPEKKRSTRPRPEERERGNWRWNGKVDEDE